ncbi:LacI family transcriptional regulator [Belliella sp. DSM 111904]|uniref:LacI family transcriptional regulator n=1 Tax=Belliella filtrata TaxID=2923435 RepID=A0ABS9V2W9_9BACT|nr:LacI family DNA-binding transcriptional regulator [Belliella filtrata]MCH7410761.1 LacI family transcriptional regulator [Belliella filtrata]
MSLYKKRVNIRDLAKILGVTPSTISRALNGHESISDSRKDQIVQLAKELGYRPNQIAKSMVSNKTFTIGLLLPEFTHNYFNNILAGIESVSFHKGYQLFICTSDELKEKEEKSCMAFLNTRVDGVLAAVGNDSDDLSHFETVIEDGTPLVLLDRICEDLNTSYVVTDDFQGSLDAVQYLVQTGCKQILHIKGPEYISTSFNRYLGYLEGLKKNGLSLEEDMILLGEDEDFEKKLQRILDTNDVDGIFAFSDYYAYDAIKVLQKRGISIPDQISVIGYADEPIAQYISPQLSTVKQPAFEIGKHAAEILFKMIEDKNSTIMSKQLATTLIIRESTK